jgi:hypothetical protein
MLIAAHERQHMSMKIKTVSMRLILVLLTLSSPASAADIQGRWGVRIMDFSNSSIREWVASYGRMTVVSKESRPENSESINMREIYILRTTTRREFWLLREIHIEWKFPDCAYMGRHKYSNNHLFTVERPQDQSAGTKTIAARKSAACKFL